MSSLNVHNNKLKHSENLMLTHGGGHLWGDGGEVELPCGDIWVRGEGCGKSGEEGGDELIIPRV